MHAVNTPSEPFVVATAHDERRADFGAAFPCRRYVVATDAVIPGSTDGWMERCGGVGIGYESGHMKDLARLAEVKAGVDRVMRKLGLIGGRAASGQRQAVIRIEEPIVLDGEAFAFAPGRGREGFEPFAKGDVLGYVDGKPFRAPFSGLLLFPKPKRLHKSGSPVGFLAVREK